MGRGGKVGGGEEEKEETEKEEEEEKGRGEGEGEGRRGDGGRGPGKVVWLELACTFILKLLVASYDHVTSLVYTFCLCGLYLPICASCRVWIPPEVPRCSVCFLCLPSCSTYRVAVHKTHEKESISVPYLRETSVVEKVASNNSLPASVRSHSLC